MTEWIDVKDELPKNNQHVLTYTAHPTRDPLKYGSTGLGFYSNGEKMVKNWFIFHADDPDGYNNITHWMPLPDPPGTVAKSSEEETLEKKLRKKKVNSKAYFTVKMEKTIIQTLYRRLMDKIVHVEYVYAKRRNESNELFKVKLHGRYGARDCIELGGACVLEEALRKESSDEQVAKR